MHASGLNQPSRPPTVQEGVGFVVPSVKGGVEWVWVKTFSHYRLADFFATDLSQKVYGEVEEANCEANCWWPTVCKKVSMSLLSWSLPISLSGVYSRPTIIFVFYAYCYFLDRNVHWLVHVRY